MIKRIRGLLTEFGLVFVCFAQSPEALRLALPDTIEDASNEFPTLAWLAVQRAHLSGLEVECRIA